MLLAKDWRHTALRVAENGKAIAQRGGASQISLAAAGIALVGFWRANVAGAALLNTSHMGQAIAWLLPVFVNRALVWALATVMIVPLFARGRGAEATAGSHRVGVLFPESQEVALNEERAITH